MISYDLVVLGAGKTGRRIAFELAKQGLKSAIVMLNDDSATEFERTIYSLAKGEIQPPSESSGPEGVDSYRGNPEFTPQKNHLRVGDVELTAKNFVLATGSVPHIPRIQGMETTPYFTPLQTFSQGAVSKSTVVLGGGYQGVRMAEWLIARKVNVVLITNKESILPHQEAEIVQLYTSRLQKQGVQIILKSDVIQTRKEGDVIKVVLRRDDERKEVDTEQLILATGFRSNSDSFLLENQQVYRDSLGRVVVDDLMRTSAPHIWAAGSVTGPPFNLSLEAHQADMVIHNIPAPFFQKIRLDADSIPDVYPTQIPIARLGKKEDEARNNYGDAHAALWTVHNEGLIKLIGRRKSGTILGVHLMAREADQWILFFDLAMRAGISIFDLLDRRHFPVPGEGDLIFGALKNWAET